MNPLDFDRVVMIGLDRRADRMRRFWRELPSPWPFRSVIRAEGIDGAKVPSPSWYASQPQECGEGIVWSQPNSHETLRGAWGCLRSHHRIWETALNRNSTALLVFEDDALFRRCFVFRAQQFLNELPSDWDQVYFGGQHLVDPVTISEHVVKCARVARTHAYGIRRPMLEAAYTRLAGTFAASLDADEYHVDRQLSLMHATGKWNVYAPTSWLVGQAAGASDVLSTGRDPGEQWWPHV